MDGLQALLGIGGLFVAAFLLVLGGLWLVFPFVVMSRLDKIIEQLEIANEKLGNPTPVIVTAPTPPPAAVVEHAPAAPLRVSTPTKPRVYKID